MKVPFSWLKQYVDIDVSAQELETKLFDCGFEFFYFKATVE